MTLFEGEQNGRYETDHLHMVLNEHIDFTEEGLSDDRKYSIFVHEYVHYYQHFATNCQAKSNHTREIMGLMLILRIVLSFV